MLRGYVRAGAVPDRLRYLSRGYLLVRRRQVVHPVPGGYLLVRRRHVVQSVPGGDVLDGRQEHLYHLPSRDDVRPGRQRLRALPGWDVLVGRKLSAVSSQHVLNRRRHDMSLYAHTRTMAAGWISRAGR